MIALWDAEVTRQLENVTMDWRFRARADTDPPPDPRIAMIGIGDQSLDIFGRWEEWGRDIHGQFSKALTLRPPRVLAFDFFFPEESQDTAEDEAFADGLSFHPAAITGIQISVDSERGGDDSEPIYFGKTAAITQIAGDRSEILGGEQANTAIPILAESAWQGVVNCPTSDLDGMRRKMPLVGRIGEEVYPSLVLQILMQLGNTTASEITVTLGKEITVPREGGEPWIIPIDERGFLPINYRTTDRLALFDYAAVFRQLLEFESGGEWPEAIPTLEDQVVIIGQSAAGLSDLGETPYRAVDPLFRVQATTLDSILREDYLKDVPVAAVIIGWLLIAWATVMLLRRAHILVEIMTPLAIIAIYIALAFFLFEASSIVLPLIAPIFGFALVNTTVIGDRLIRELREKRHIHSVFGTYVARSVVDQIIQSGERPKLGGEKVEITALFSDIQAFSTFSEQLPPDQLVDLMVDYLSEMSDILHDEMGTLDKYIGDAIVAMFGAPLPQSDHAYRAVVTAIRMQRKQDELCAFWKEESGYPPIVHEMKTRIGLNTGPAVVGNMGSRRQLNYTMMGDTVNLAARSESGAKSYGVYTMITGDTCEAARAEKDDITYRYLDQLIVKGRSLPVKMYEVVEFTSEIDDDTSKCLDSYAKGIAAYLEQNWDEADAHFLKSSTLERHQPGRDAGVTTNPSLVMAARCAEMRALPPEADWDGIYRMTSK